MTQTYYDRYGNPIPAQGVLNNPVMGPGSDVIFDEIPRTWIPGVGMIPSSPNLPGPALPPPPYGTPPMLPEPPQSSGPRPGVPPMLPGQQRPGVLGAILGGLTSPNVVQGLSTLLASRGKYGGYRAQAMQEGFQRQNEMDLKNRQLAMQQQEINANNELRKQQLESQKENQRQGQLSTVMEWANKLDVPIPEAAAALGVQIDPARADSLEKARQNVNARNSIIIDLQRKDISLSGETPEQNPNLIRVPRTTAFDFLKNLKGSDEWYIGDVNGKQTIVPRSQVDAYRKQNGDSVNFEGPIPNYEQARLRLKDFMPDTSFQRVEIMDRNAPDGHRTALFDPKSARVLDIESRREIPNAQQYYRPPQSAVQTDAQTQRYQRIADSLAGHRDAKGNYIPGDLTKLRDVASLRGDARSIIYDMVKQKDKDFNLSEIDRQIKAEDDVMNGKSGQQLQSFGTFLEHAGALRDTLDTVYNTNNRYWNKGMSWWRQNMSGDPNFQAFLTAMEPVRQEFSRFLSGGLALHEDEIRNANIILNPDSSPAAINAAIKEMGLTAKARYNEINYRYKRVRHQDIQDPFSPEAISGAKRIGVDLGITPTATAAPNEWDQFWIKK